MPGILAAAVRHPKAGAMTAAQLRLLHVNELTVHAWDLAARSTRTTDSMSGWCHGCWSDLSHSVQPWASMSRVQPTICQRPVRKGVCCGFSDAQGRWLQSARSYTRPSTRDVRGDDGYSRHQASVRRKKTKPGATNCDSWSRWRSSPRRPNRGASITERIMPDGFRGSVHRLGRVPVMVSSSRGFVEGDR